MKRLLILLGSSLLCCLVLSQPGTLDSTFAINGLAFTPSPNANLLYCEDVIVQSDDKVIAIGRESQQNILISFALVRYNADGSLDPTFGTNGLVTTSLTGQDDRIAAVALQLDGGIVVAGHTFEINSLWTGIVARYIPNGALDNSFGSGGIVDSLIQMPSSAASDVLIQPDSMILVAGNALDSSGMRGVFLTRIHVDGTPDPFFGTDGVVLLMDPQDTTNYLEKIALQPDGKILFAGVSSITGGNGRLMVKRFLDNGQIDTTFSGTGTYLGPLTNISSIFAGIALQSSGKIIATCNDLGDIVTYQLEPTGLLDTTFGTNGIASVTILGGGAMGYDLHLQPDGKILVAGEWGGIPNQQTVLFRLDQTGFLDPTFGSNGIVLSLYTNYTQTWRGVDQQADGKIVVGGFTFIGSGKIVVARLLNEPLSVGLSGERMQSQGIRSHPNPSYGRVWLNYTIDPPSSVEIHLYNMSGVKLRTIISDVRPRSGVYCEQVDFEGLAPGVYIVSLITNTGRTYLKHVKR